MLDDQIYQAKKWLYGRFNRTPVYVISKDGTLRIEWENPADKDSRAFDLEHNRQQVFVDGYANPVRIDVDNVEYSDPEKDAEPDLSLIPSDRYQQYMSQKIVSDALQGGSISGQKLMWLSMANIGAIVLFGVIILSVIT